MSITHPEQISYVPTGGTSKSLADELDALATFTPSGTGAVARTITSRLSETISVKDFGAVGDAVTDDTAAIQATINTADAMTPRVVPIYLPPGTYLYTTLTNPQGHQFIGPGRIVKAITGGQQQLNSYADAGKYVVGREYMSYFHKLIMARTLDTQMVFTGDSTTAGTGATTPFRIWELLPQFALLEGFPRAKGVNRGQSGMTTADWISTYLTGDLAALPDVLIIRWGINDPKISGQHLTIDQFAANIRSGLATIRASKTVAQLSIVLCTPNSVSDTPDAIDERWNEQVYPVLLQAARDYHAVFVDVYGYLRDSKDAAGAADWMDTLVDGVSHVHPQNVENIWIASLLGDVLFPRALRLATSDSAIINPSSNQPLYTTAPLASSIPTTYARGITIRNVLASNGFPFNGMLLTVVQADGIWMQLNAGLAYPVSVAIRHGVSSGSAWGPWWQALGSNRGLPSWAATVTINVDSYQWFDINASAATGTLPAITIANPSGTAPQTGQAITIKMRNTSGGVLGAVTWGTLYKISVGAGAGQWANPATGFSRSVVFQYDGTNWVQTGAVSPDVPN